MSNSLWPYGLQHTRPSCPSPFELAQTHVHWVGDAFPPSHLLLPLSPANLNFSQHQGFFSQWVSYSHQVAKVLEFQISSSPSNEYSRLISFRIDWFDSRSLQGTLKSLLQHNSKASILLCSASFIPTLTSIHGYWKNHRFDCIDLSWQSNVSAF